MPVERRRLASMISVRFLPAEEERVRAAAASRGESVSNFVRHAAVREADRSGAADVTMTWYAPPARSGAQQLGTTSSAALVRLLA